MIQPCAKYLRSCDDDDCEGVTVMPGAGELPLCGKKQLLMAPKVRLSSGQDMPALGFGTYKLKGYECATAVHCAIETGFRLFDTAYCYENEDAVGDAIRTQIGMGNVSRENIFLVTKLWCTHHEPQDVGRICRKQLEALGMDYIDLYLIHFPVGFQHLCDEILYPKEGEMIALSDVDYLDTWRAMEQLVKEGLVRSIGVSNFSIDQIQRVIQNCQFKPVVNQIELWPGFMQKDMCDYCRYQGIIVVAYAPLGQPDRETHKPIYFFSVKMKQICRRYKKKAGQITLRYLIDSGVVPIPKAANPLHIRQNMEIFDFKLNDDDMRAFRGIKPKKRLVKWTDVDTKHQFYPFETDDEDEGEEEEEVRPAQRKPRKHHQRKPQQQQQQQQQAQAAAPAPAAEPPADEAPPAEGGEGEGEGE